MRGTGPVPQWFRLSRSGPWRDGGREHRTMPDSTPPPVEIEVEPAGSDVPADLRTIFLGGLLLLTALAACYVAAEIVLPIVLAFVLSAMFQPLLRFLWRIGLPRVLAALTIVLALVTACMV